VYYAESRTVVLTFKCVQRFFFIAIFAGIAQAIEPLAIHDLDGKQHIVIDSNGWVNQSPMKVTVLIFINTHCPIANSYHPVLKQMADEFCEVGGFTIALIHANPSLTISEARTHQLDFDIQLPIVLDPDQTVAKAVKATVTPEAIVIDPAGSILYRGRIDDRYASIGKKRAIPRREDLRLALQSIAKGQPIEVSTTQAIGCRIAY
jgi:hypothetical protein